MSNARFIAAFGAALALLANSPAPAQEYPSKSIRIIAQFTPGTSTDILARLIAQKMSSD